MKTEIPNLPPHVADAVYLATATTDGHAYETKVIRGRDLLKQYAAFCWMHEGKDASDDELAAVGTSLADPNCWYLVGFHWAEYSTEFEDGTVAFYLITDPSVLASESTAETQAAHLAWEPREVRVEIKPEHIAAPAIVVTSESVRR